VTGVVNQKDFYYHVLKGEKRIEDIECNEAGGSTVFIDNDGYMDLIGLEFFHQLGNFHAFWYEADWFDDIFNSFFAF
jgi:hypothetical protein